MHRRFIAAMLDSAHVVGLSGIACVAIVATCAQRTPEPGWSAHTNNAVAAVASPQGVTLVTTLGLTSGKTWRNVSNQAVAYTPETDNWRALAPVPGPGRLAATAQTIRGKIYLFGGYTVDSSGNERSMPNVDIYDPRTNRWSRGADMRVAVDDAVSGTYRDSLVYIVSGWHDTDNVRDVQIYDPARDVWLAATPFPGTPVFGHSGSLARNTIVIVDGTRRNDARPRYSIVKQAWRGDIDSLQPTRITWRAIEQHAGPALYRAAAGACARYVIIAGGSDTPYNYTGIGYDGAPATPRDAILAYDTESDRWQSLGRAPAPSMDHRGLVVTADGSGWTVGGMRGAQEVSPEVARLDLPICRLTS